MPESRTLTREVLDERTNRMMALINASKEVELERHRAIDERIATAQTVLDARLKTSMEVLETRLHLLNELRGDVITKTEYTAQHSVLAAELRNLEKLHQVDVSNLREWRANQEGKASHTSVVFAGTIAVLSLILSAAALFHEMYR
jgi:hypothetical protein